MASIAKSKQPSILEKPLSKAKTEVILAFAHKQGHIWPPLIVLVYLVLVLLSELFGITLFNRPSFPHFS